MIIIPVLSAALLIQAPHAPVQGFMDLGGLHTLCAPAPDQDPTAASLCYGYVIGVVDQLMVQQARRPALHLRRTICLPRETSAQAIHAAVLNALQGQSARSGVAAAGFIRQAMELSFPCAGGQTPKPRSDDSEPMR